MRKTGSLLLLFIFLLSTAGFYPLFKIVQYNVRKEIKSLIKQALPEKELDVIILNEGEHASLRWEWNGKEFWYKNSLYDVVRSEKKNGTITYFCINDRQETRLFTNLDKLVQDHKETRGLALNVLKLLTCLYLPVESCCLSVPSSFKTQPFIPPLKSYLSFYGNPFSLPPEII